MHSTSEDSHPGVFDPDSDAMLTIMARDIPYNPATSSSSASDWPNRALVALGTHDHYVCDWQPQSRKTGRSLAVRINEHKPTSSKASHMKDHVRRAGHQFSDENVRLLHAIDEGPRLYAYEKLEIMKCKKRRGDMCLNVQSDFHSEVFEVVVDEEQRATGGVTRRERGEVRSPRHNPEVQLVAASQPQYASDSLRGGAAL